MIGSMLHEPFYTSGTRIVPRLGVYAAWVGFDNAPAAAEVQCADDPELVLLRSGEFFDGEKEMFARYRAGDAKFAAPLNGSFSGLLIDERAGRVSLFNDRYGFDRVYIHQAEDAFYFASEAKALLAVVPASRQFDRAGLADLLTFGCTTQERTLFRGLSLLPAASTWRINADEVEKRSYFSSEAWENQALLSETEFEQEFVATVREVMPNYFQSSGDQLGVSLTAGLDSRVVLAARPANAQVPPSYTYDGPTGETLDAQLARQVAARAGLPHHLVRLGEDFLANFAEHVDRTVHLTDGTFGATGAHELYLSRAARAVAPLRLTGVFGGEIFRGVSTFKELGLDRRLYASSMAPDIAQSAQRIAIAGDNPVSRAAFKEIPWGIFGSVACCRSQLCFRTPYLNNRLVSLAYRTPHSMRGSGRAFETAVAKLAPALSVIPTDMGMLGSTNGFTRLRRKALAKVTFKLAYLTNDGMPGWIGAAGPIVEALNRRTPLLNRHKYLTYRRWFRRELAGYIRETLAAAAERSTLWNGSFVRSMAEEHISGRANYVQEINAVLTIDAIERAFFSPKVGHSALEPALV